MIQAQHIANRSYAFVIAAFALSGVVMPFSSLWLASQGFGFAQISLAISVGYLFRSLLTLLIALKFSSMSPLIAATWISIGLIATSALMFSVAGVMLSAACAVTVIGLTFAIQPMSEAYLVNSVNDGVSNYSLTKISGSIFFAVTGSIFPLLYTFMPIQQLYPIVIGALALTLFMISQSRERTSVMREVGAFHEVTRIAKTLAPVLIPSALIQGSNSFYYALAFPDWSEAGISMAAASALWVTAVSAEIIAFKFGIDFFRKYKSSTILIVCAVFATARWLIFSSTTALPILFLAQLGHAFSFAICHYVITREIATSFNPGQQLLAHGLASFVVSFFGLFLGMAVVLPLAFAIDLNGYIAMAVVSISAIGFVLAGSQRSIR